MALSSSDEEVRGRLRHLNPVALSKAITRLMSNVDETVSFHDDWMQEYEHRTLNSTCILPLHTSGCIDGVPEQLEARPLAAEDAGGNGAAMETKPHR
jgi:hypothetical protein